MDRLINWAGAVPLETDLLNTNRNTMIALGRLAMDLIGTSTSVSGLACTQTSVPSMSVQIGAGSIYSQQNIDGSAYSSLPANTTDQIAKQGILFTSDNRTLAMSAPTTPGYSVIYLIEAAFSETDTSPVVLPFYNASNPTIPYSGPANSGTTSYTVRKGGISLIAKAGVAAASPTAPAVDAGYVPLYTVTIAYGASSIVNANIAVASGAPFMTSLGAIGTSFLPLAGGTMAGPLITSASAPGGAGFRLPHGTAPTSPVNGAVWTTTAGLYAQINGVTVGPMLPVSGGTLTGELVTAASGTGGAGLNAPHGAAPTAPVNGDIWTTTAGMFVRVNGVTIGPLISTAGATMTGVLALYQGSTINDAGGTPYVTGYRDIPQNAQSAAYTLTLADAGRHIYHPSADTTARTWTIPSNASVAFPIGTAITFCNDTSAGALTIAISTDTLVMAPGGATGSRTLAANGIATAVKVTSTRWMISGSGLS